MNNFKITTAHAFKGMPSTVGNVANQIVSIKSNSFENKIDSEEITLKVSSRVYIDESSCTDVEAKESNIATLTESLNAKAVVWKAKVDEYNTSNNPVHATEARALHTEAAAIETSIKEVIDTIDRSLYYDNVTTKTLSSAAELLTALADTRAVVKADELFSGATTVDL